ncbi:PIG-L deacetylase family protein [Microbacterium gorillae]|uniref:PIG-L deacetylase family protein n=1 Tax=Microbacterium gorillae TaxID=1231063 RepID=UPI00058AF1BE|nr:PIG-L family deacetylase [Microbacterium gorillae]
MARHAQAKWKRTPVGVVVAVCVVLALIAVGGAIGVRHLLGGGGLFAAGATPRPTLTPVPAHTTPSAPPSPHSPSAPTTPPVSPAALPCDGPTTMSVMAHYDDDLLFANPTLMKAERDGGCVRTVFVTAGDAGKGFGYVKDREEGLMRAYNIMRGAPVDARWDVRDVDLRTGLHLTTVSPQGDPRITVVLMRLPDGDIDANGFDSTGHATIMRLLDGDITEARQLDTDRPVTREELVTSVQELIRAYDPQTLIGMVPLESHWHVGDDPRRPDHPDHGAVGSLLRTAWTEMGFPESKVRYAVGYPGRSLAANVSGEDLRIKIDAFRTYSAKDSVSRCTTDESCLKLKPFGTSLQREYLLTDAELF